MASKRNAQDLTLRNRRAAVLRDEKILALMQKLAEKLTAQIEKLDTRVGRLEQQTETWAAALDASWKSAHDPRQKRRKR